MLLGQLEHLGIVLLALPDRLGDEHAPQFHAAVIRAGGVEALEVQVAVSLHDGRTVNLDVEARRQAGNLAGGPGDLTQGLRLENLAQLGRLVANLLDLAADPLDDPLPGKTIGQLVAAGNRQPALGEPAGVQSRVRTGESITESLLDGVLLKELLDIGDPVPKLRFVNVVVQQLLLDLFQQFLDCLAHCLGQRLGAQRGKHPLEARLDIIPGHALGGVLGQIFQNGLEDKGRCFSYSPECQPLDHHGLPLPVRKDMVRRCHSSPRLCPLIEIHHNIALARTLG